MDFFKRRKDLSDSSASLSPTGLTLESPSTFQVSAVKPALSEATMKQKDKQDAVLAMPSMFQEEKEADEKILTDLTRGAPADPANVYLAPKTIDEDETNKNKNHYLEETFAIRAPHNTPKTRVGQESIVVVDIRINARVS